MKAFIPPGKVHFCDAIETAANQWFRSEVSAASLTPEEKKKLVDYSSLKKENDKKESGLPVQISDEQRKLFAPEGEAEISNLKARISRRLKIYNLTWERLGARLFNNDLTVSVITERGTIFDVPSQFWGSKEGRSAYKAESPTIIARTMKLSFNDPAGYRVSGTPFLDIQHLENILAGRPAVPPNNNATTPVSHKDEPPAADLNTSGRQEELYTSKKGAPKKYDDIELLIQAARLVYDGFQPDNQAHLLKEALGAYQEKTLQVPSEEWAKPIIRRFWNGLELKRRDKGGG